MMNESVHALTQLWRSMRFLQLLIFMIITMAIRAVYYDSFIISLLVSLLYFNILKVTISATISNKRKTRIDDLLYVLLILIVIFRHIIQADSLIFVVIADILVITLIGFCIASIMRYVLTSKQVTIDILFAGIVNYFLIALLFAQGYATVEALLPNSFSYANPHLLTEGFLTPHIFTYFSMVTITTVGYGDVLPTHPITQMLATLEAATGQFYVAIIVAWLVTMYVLHNTKKE